MVSSAPGIVGQGDLPILRRRGEEHGHRATSVASVPETSRDDEDRARVQRDLDATFGGEYAENKLAFQHMEQLVAIGVPLPRWLPREAHRAEQTLIELAENPRRVTSAEAHLLIGDPVEDRLEVVRLHVTWPSPRGSPIPRERRPRCESRATTGCPANPPGPRCDRRTTRRSAPAGTSQQLTSTWPACRPHPRRQRTCTKCWGARWGSGRSSARSRRCGPRRGERRRSGRPS